MEGAKSALPHFFCMLHAFLAGDLELKRLTVSIQKVLSPLMCARAMLWFLHSLFIGVKIQLCIKTQTLPRNFLQALFLTPIRSGWSC